jgi:hypothetical protein
VTEQPIFIVGCPRSGTSLLRDLLRSHPHLTFPNESHFISGFYRAYGDPRSDDEARILARRILDQHWIRSWGLELDPEAFADARSFREVVSRLFSEWARREGKPRWGDKTPHYVTDLPVLAELFPACRILHIHRDGRDVALSWLRTGMEPRNVYTAAKAWKERVTVGRRAGTALGPETYREVSFEALVTHPREVMMEVCEFVGESFTEEVLRPSLLPRLYRPRWIRRRPPRPPREVIDPSHAGGWRDRMTPRQRVLFESVAGDLLADLGYPIEGRVRRVGPLERLAWSAHHGFLWVARRLNDRATRELLSTHLAARR